MAGLVTPVDAQDRASIVFTIDGASHAALEGDTVLTALLRHADHLRRHDFGGELRAGFCMMGACQDCWVTLGDGRRLRACSAPLEPGMSITGLTR